MPSLSRRRAFVVTIALISALALISFIGPLRHPALESVGETAVAGGSGGGGQIIVHPPHDGDTTFSNPFDDPATQQALEDERERMRRDRAARGTADARERRLRSRTAHRGLTQREAADLVRQRFRDVAERPPFKSLNLRGGETVGDWLGHHAARIESDEGAALVESLLPLRVDSGEGPRLVDLRLKRDGTRFSPINPHVAVRIGGEAPLRVELPDVGVVVEQVVPERTRPPEPLDMEHKVFWGNVDVDTDVIAAPLPAGVELLAQLRSIESPSIIRWRVGLPERATMRQEGAGGAISIERDGTTLARVQPARAWDADGEPVPTGFEVSGNTIVAHVDHRDHDVHYPVLVDPAFVEDFRYWNSNPSLDFKFWRFSSVGPFNSLAGNWYLGSGLYAYTRVAQNFTGNDYGNWEFFAPGTGQGEARIYRAEFGYVTHEPQNTCITERFRRPSGYAPTGATWTQPDGAATGESPWTYCGATHYNYKTHCVVATCAPAGDAMRASFGTTMVSGTAGSRSNFTTYMGSAAVFIDDSTAPTIEPGPYLSDAPTFMRADSPVRAGVNDGGVGMKRASVTVGGRENDSWEDTSGCNGTRHARCPGGLSMPIRTDVLADGVHAATFHATDALGNSRQRTWTIKLDRAPPRMHFGGTMYPEGTTDPTGEVNVERAKPYQLEMQALDGSPAEPRAGVKSIRVKLDGIEVATTGDLPCPEESCPLDLAWEYAATNDTAAGRHWVEVISDDVAGNSVTNWIALNVTEPDPTPQPPGSVPGVTKVRGTGPGCEAPPELVAGLTVQTTGGPILTAHGTWSGGAETTDWHGPETYEIRRCDPDGSLNREQDVGPLIVPGGNIVRVPYSDTFRIGAGEYETLHPHYGNAENSEWAAIWAAEGAGATAAVLPPTLPFDTP